MKMSRGKGLSSKIIELLMDSPRPLISGEIEASFNFDYEAAQINSTLAMLLKNGKIDFELKKNPGKGRKIVKAYKLPSMPLFQ